MAVWYSPIPGEERGCIVSVDYKDIPQVVWELLSDLLRNPADGAAHIGEDAWMIAVQNGLVSDDSRLTFAGIAAIRWHEQSTTGKPTAKSIPVNAIEAMLGEEGKEVLKIARSSKSASDRAIEICAIDRRFLFYSYRDNQRSILQFGNAC